MKHSALARPLGSALFGVLLVCLLATTSCRSNKDDPQDTASDSLPATIETIPDTHPPASESETDEPPTPAGQVTATLYPSAALPDYEQYTSARRIKEVLSQGKTYAFSLNAKKFYRNGDLLDGAQGAVYLSSDGTLILAAEALKACLAGSAPSGSTPEEVAASLGMEVAVYDNKLVLFYEGELPLHTYEDLYTYEAMYLYLVDAEETEILNAFIDLPDRVSNNTSNTVYYTSPDLNLGVQTSVYYAQMGQTNGLSSAPALVAGEGKHENNFTTVRIYNDQQTCITQFLAFEASVKGGVQVAAAAVGDETLIATAPFAAYDGAGGDVRVFDAYGLLRMTLSVRDVIPGPYTILTGRFAPDVSDEVLLVASQTADADGALSYAILSLSDGSVLFKHTLDCSFAVGESKSGVPVLLSARTGEREDTLILHFPTVQGLYEGSAATADFPNAGVTLPADAVAVSASNVIGQRYIVSLPPREGDENRSFITVLSDESSVGEELDVGFMENRFYSSYYTDGYNDDRYVSRGSALHIRTDLGNNVMNRLKSCKTEAEVDAYFANAQYADYRFTQTALYADSLSNQYLFYESCFTHRWNKTANTQVLAEYVDATTGSQKYVAIGKSGEYIDYEEIGNAYYNGTYADGILELAKLRLYPLRSFLQGTAPAFRGNGANPEHLVNVSPVHEHEINVPDSVGDYNLSMIEGFRHHLLKLYGSVGNINMRFGTSFASIADIDAPRDAGRGAWDAYSGDYFTEWTMYNRSIVSKRIMEAYREALLAGYPPESITAHQIPEGEAVSGFLGQADTRLTPIDIALTCGTAYGGTRYGFIVRGGNFISNANAMGHWSTSIGEYCAMQDSPGAAYKQLEYLWERGVRMINHITFTDAQEAAEAEAIRRLMEKNLPRPGYTGGTSGSVTVAEDGRAYNIVQIGAGADSDSTGLLKSIDANGKWEGTVYLVPFHTEIRATAIEAMKTPTEGTKNRFSTGILPTIKNADQVEVTFVAAYHGEGKAFVTCEVYHDGCLMEPSVTSYDLTSTRTPYRYVLSNQLYETALEVVVTIHTPDEDMEGVVLENMTATLQTETAAFTYYDGSDADQISRAHVGGVTFDLLDRDEKRGTGESLMPPPPEDDEPQDRPADAPLYIADPATMANDSYAYMTYVTDKGHYALFDGAHEDTDNDPSVLVMNGEAIPGTFIAVMYRTLAKGNNLRGEFFAGSGGGAVGGSSTVFSYINDGRWHYQIIDVAAHPDMTGKMAYIRYDYFNAANHTIDVAYVAVFDSMEHAESYCAKALVALEETEQEQVILFHTSIDYVNGSGPNGTSHYTSRGGNTDAGCDVIDGAADQKTTDETGCLTVGGWCGTSGGVNRYVWTVDGTTWYDCASGGRDGEPIDGHYAGIGFTDALKNGMFNIGDDLCADLSAYKGTTVDVTFGFVPERHPSQVVAFVQITGVEVK